MDMAQHRRGRLGYFCIIPLKTNISDEDFAWKTANWLGLYGEHCMEIWTATLNLACRTFKINEDIDSTLLSPAWPRITLSYVITLLSYLLKNHVMNLGKTSPSVCF